MTSYQNDVVFDIETTGLNPWMGDRITCICAREIYSTKSFCVSQRSTGLLYSESEIIFQFLRWLQSFPPDKTRFITANGKQFDIPFICARLSILLLDPEQSICERKFLNPLFLLSYDHLDLLNDITDKTISLNNICRILQISPKKQDGKDAIKLFYEDKFDELEKYCFHDVELTEKVYKRIYSLRIDRFITP